MKIKFVFLIILFFCYKYLFSQRCSTLYVCYKSAAYSKSLEEKWEKEMYRQMKVLEEKFKISFEKDWFPRVSFIANQYYAAEYDQNTKSFNIVHGYQTLLGLPKDTLIQETAFVTNIIGHELGHALVDQISHRINCITWPKKSIWENGTEREKFVQKILSEGTASYFGELLSPELPNKHFYLPKNKKHCVWHPIQWVYISGYWVVKPILDKFGEEGLKYIINNTNFPGKSYNLNKAAKKYQKRAIKKLYLKNKSRFSVNTKTTF